MSALTFLEMFSRELTLKVVWLKLQLSMIASERESVNDTLIEPKLPAFWNDRLLTN